MLYVKHEKLAKQCVYMFFSVIFLFFVCSFPFYVAFVRNVSWFMLSGLYHRRMITSPQTNINTKIDTKPFRFVTTNKCIWMTVWSRHTAWQQETQNERKLYPKDSIEKNEFISSSSTVLFRRKKKNIVENKSRLFSFTILTLINFRVWLLHFPVVYTF